MIPQNSPYYSKAQQLMAMIHGDEEPLPPPDAKDFSSMESETVVPDTVLPDTVQVIPAREVTASQPSRKKRIFYPGWLLPIALLVMGGLLAYLAITRTPKRRPAVKKQPHPSWLLKPHWIRKLCAGWLGSLHPMAGLVRKLPVN